MVVGLYDVYALVGIIIVDDVGPPVLTVVLDMPYQQAMTGKVLVKANGLAVLKNKELVGRAGIGDKISRVGLSKVVEFDHRIR